MSETAKDKLANLEKMIADTGIDRDTMMELLKMLLSQTKQTHAKLRQAIETACYEEVRLLAHDIKGSCGNFRLMDIYETAAAIEKMGKDRVAVTEISELDTELGQMLDGYMKELGI